MAYASRSGRARTNPRNPSAFGVCDRDGLWYNLSDLVWQHEWAGPSLINKRIRVCRNCLDIPNQQLRSIIIPADPTPVSQPRTEPYLTDETNSITTQGNTTDPSTGIPVVGGDQIATQDDALVSGQATGEPPGGVNQEPGTDPNAPGNDDPGVPLGYTEVPKTGPPS